MISPKPVSSGSRSGCRSARDSSRQLALNTTTPMSTPRPAARKVHNQPRVLRTMGATQNVARKAPMLMPM